MGRIRTIKPEFFLHEGLFDLEEETSLPIRISFAGLWTQCDREGLFKWQPRRLKTQILPYDAIDFSRVLDALTTRGFLEKYEVEGVIYGAICGFLDHQVVNNREKASIFPKPSEGAACDACPTRHDPALVEGKGREGKGKEGKEISVPRKRGTPAMIINPEYFAAAEQMWELVAPITKAKKPASLSTWADDIRKLVEIDGRALTEVAEVFVWANQNEFWSANVLSAKKLREKFPTLYAQMERDNKANEKPDYLALSRSIDDVSYL